MKPGFRAVHFCRHGESTFNARGLIGGDGPLSQKGQNFARALGEYVNVAKLGENKHGRTGGGKDCLHVWTSCLRRAKETAAHLIVKIRPHHRVVLVVEAQIVAILAASA